VQEITGLSRQYIWRIKTTPASIYPAPVVRKLFADLGLYDIPAAPPIFRKKYLYGIAKPKTAVSAPVS
jgi:hypothetical protein